jgi:plasmid replication initiation protein
VKKKQPLNNDFKIIKKSNQLIEARYKFDVWESRMFLSVLSNIRKEDVDFNTYRIWYRDIIKIFGLKSNQSYALLREAAKSLMQKKFYITSSDNGFERETAYHIIRSVNYLKDGQKGDGVEQQEYIDITVEPEMKPLLLQLQQNFTAYNIQSVAKLGTSALRLYELLKQYEFLGVRTMDIDYIKHILEMETEYALFADFYKWFILPALRDINLYSDLEVGVPEKIKQGKKIVSLKFSIHKKKVPIKSLLVDSETVESPIGEIALDEPKTDLIKEYFDRLNEWWGVQKEELQKRIVGKTANDIETAIEFTKMRIKTGKVNNPAGVFLDALFKGYKSPEQIQEEKRQQKILAEKERKLQLQTLTDTYNQLLDTYSQKVNDTIREITQADPSVTETVIEKIKALFRSMGDRRVEGKSLDDFRKDEYLRSLVMREILIQCPEHFEKIHNHYNAEIDSVKNKIISIEPKYKFE